MEIDKAALEKQIAFLKRKIAESGPGAPEEDSQLFRELELAKRQLREINK